MRSAGGESTPLKGTNREFVQKVVAALEQAIVARG